MLSPSSAARVMQYEVGVKTLKSVPTVLVGLLFTLPCSVLAADTPFGTSRPGKVSITEKGDWLASCLSLFCRQLQRRNKKSVPIFGSNCSLIRSTFT